MGQKHNAHNLFNPISYSEQARLISLQTKMAKRKKKKKKRQILLVFKTKMPLLEAIFSKQCMIFTCSGCGEAHSEERANAKALALQRLSSQ